MKKQYLSKSVDLPFYGELYAAALLHDQEFSPGVPSLAGTN